MKLTDLFLAQLDTEAVRTRHALERTPEGREDWKPHEKSMPLGRLAMLVARMPSWISLIVKQVVMKYSVSDSLRRAGAGARRGRGRGAQGSEGHH